MKITPVEIIREFGILQQRAKRVTGLDLTTSEGCLILNFPGQKVASFTDMRGVSCFLDGYEMAIKKKVD